MKTNEQVRGSVAEWEQAIIGAAGEESYQVSNDKKEHNEENGEEGTEAMLERDLRRLSLDPTSIDKQPVVTKAIRKQSAESRSKNRRKPRTRLSLPSESSTEDEQQESEIEDDAAPVTAPSGVRRSHRQQNIPAPRVPLGYFRKTHRGIGRHAFNPLHSASDDDDAMMGSGPEDNSGI